MSMYEKIKEVIEKEIVETKDCVKCDETFLTTIDEDTCYDCEQGFNDYKIKESESA